ncbi:MAG: lipopolysaccharide biosynthesis protein [Bacteroidota bacterium]
MADNSFMKSGLFYMMGNLLSRGISFLLLPLYSRYISAEEYGIYALLLAFYTVVSALLQGGLQNGFAKYYFETSDRHKRELIFSSYFNGSLIISLAVCSLLFIFSGTVSKLLLGSSNASGLVRIVLLMNFIDALMFISLYLLKTMELSGRVFYLSGISAVLNLLLNVWLIMFRKTGIEGILWAQIITNTIILAILLFGIRRYIRPVIVTGILKKIIIFSAPLAIAGIFTDLTDVADRFILNIYLDAKTVGIYSFSYKIAMVMNVLVISFRTAWTPYSLRTYRERQDYGIIFASQFKKLIAMSALLFLAVSIFIDDLFILNISGERLFDAQYLPGITIIPVVLAGYIFNGLASFFSVYPFVSNKSYHFLAADTIAAASNIAINFLLIPVWGIMGAAFATCVSYLFCMVYLALISRSIEIRYDYIRLVIFLIIIIAFFVISKYTNNIFLDVILLITALPAAAWFSGIRLHSLSLIKPDRMDLR